MFYIYADGELLYNPLNTYRLLTKPKLVLEVGKAGSFEFSLPPSNTMYSRLRKLQTTITVELDDREIFRGRVLNEKRNFHNIKQIYCEGDLAYLVDSKQKPEAFTGWTHDFFRRIIERHNAKMETHKRFVPGIITVENREIIISGQSDEDMDASENFDYRQIAINSMTNEWQNTYEYIQNCLIDYCGGYLRTRRENGVTYLDWITGKDERAAQEIEFGVNMLDLSEEVSPEGVFTVLIPLGEENLTIASVNGGSDELEDESAISLYTRIYETHKFDNVTDPALLLENARRYMQSHVNLPTTITIKAVDMHFVNPMTREILIGDSVRVNSTPHSIVEYLTCTKIEYDLDNPANTSYTFGNPKQTLTERYRKNMNKIAETSIANASSGGGGSGKKADDAAKEALERFYDAWINVDKDSAHIDLGAVYRELRDSKKTLEQYVGVDFNAVENNVHLFALRDCYDELEKVTTEQAATIDLLADDTQSKIDIVTAYVDKVKGDEASHYAELTLRADQHGSAIDMKADKITLESKITEINSEITQVKKLIADKIEAVKAEMENTFSKKLSTVELFVSNGAYFSCPISAFAGINFKGSSVGTSTVPVVTQFTQASGETAPVVSHTFLYTSIKTPVARMPLLGDVIDFTA